MERVVEFLEKPHKASDKDLAAKVSRARQAAGALVGVVQGNLLRASPVRHGQAWTMEVEGPTGSSTCIGTPQPAKHTAAATLLGLVL